MVIGCSQQKGPLLFPKADMSNEPVQHPFLDIKKSVFVSGPRKILKDERATPKDKCPVDI